MKATVLLLLIAWLAPLAAASHLDRVQDGIAVSYVFGEGSGASTADTAPESAVPGSAWDIPVNAPYGAWASDEPHGMLLDHACEADCGEGNVGAYDAAARTAGTESVIELTALFGGSGNAFSLEAWFRPRDLVIAGDAAIIAEALSIAGGLSTCTSTRPFSSFAIKQVRIRVCVCVCVCVCARA